MTIKYEDQMTPLERSRAYWSGEAVDRLPYSTDLGESIVPYYGLSNKDYLFSADLMVELQGRVYEDFGGDGMGFGINTRAFAEAVGSVLRYPDYGYSEIVSHRFKKAPLPLDSLPVIDPYRDGRLPIILEATKKLLDRYGDRHSIGFSIPCPANCALGLMDISDLLVLMMRNEEEFHKLMEFCLACILRCAEVFFHETGLSIGTFEVMAASQIMGQKHYRKYLSAYVERTCEGLKEITGHMPSFGGCGSNQHIWPDLMKIGINSFAIDTTDSLADAKHMLGSSSSLYGNLDPILCLTSTPEEMERAVFDCISVGSDSPCGFTLGLGGGSAAFAAPIENIRAFVRAARKYGQGAQMGKPCKGLTENKE